MTAGSHHEVMNRPAIAVTDLTGDIISERVTLKPIRLVSLD